MTLWFGLPHSPGLVALSVLMAIFGGYVGLGLADQARGAIGIYRRGLLAGAAWSLGLGIWTMHFVGMLAAQLPQDTLFSVLLTLLSFLLCVLVVGIAAFIVSNGSFAGSMIVAASIIMGMGIVTMHYVGMHAVAGNYAIHHDMRYVLASGTIAVASSYGALLVFDSRIRNHSLATSSLIFGLAVSGMHYTAMMGMEIVPTSSMPMTFGPSVSNEALMIVVALLAFVVSGAFLLYLIPERSRASDGADEADPITPNGKSQHQRVSLVPIESEGATKLLSPSEVCAVQATTHYTLVYDGQREHFCPWSISEAENRLSKDQFMRVHRSHLIALDKIRTLRRSGDTAFIEVGEPVARIVPVSRNHYAELKTRLGLQAKIRSHATSQQPV